MRLLFTLGLIVAGCDGCGRPLGDCPGGECPLDLAQLIDLATVDFSSSCSLLAEDICRARKECIADYCIECSCKPVFVGCRAPAAPKTRCPGLGCASPTCCQSQSECPTLAPLCIAPGEFSGCGICTPTPVCQSDSDCQAIDGGFGPIGHTCDDPKLYGECGSCSGSGKACISGCSSNDNCPEGQACTATHHCVGKACASAADCPQDFECASDHCQRTPCTVDGDCPIGFCVKGACYGSFGTCMPAPQ
jgi:hypothetical protein